MTIEERIEKFKKTLIPFEEIYGRDMLYGTPTQLGFFEYWTELSKNGKKFKQEKEDTWTLSRRLKTWKTNNDNWNARKQTNQNRREDARNSRESAVEIARRIRGYS